MPAALPTLALRRILAKEHVWSTQGRFTVTFWRKKKCADGPDPDNCEHTWRLRDVSVALPGPYVCEVCDRCGALHIDGPEAISGQPSNVADAAAAHLESLARRESQRHASPSPPSD